MPNAIVLQQRSDLAARSPVREAFDIMAYGLTDTSRRQYEHTLARWRDWCSIHQIAPHDLSAGNVIGFLENGQLARRTKQARLTHLRRLAQTLHTADVGNPALEQNYQQLQLLKLRKDDKGGQPRERRALTPAQVHEALRFWPQNANLGIRNRALLAVLFYAGLRRSEAVALKWSDIDFEQGLITVRHGKGNKERTIPIARPDTAIPMLARWRACVPAYEHVFVAVGKGDVIRADAPISTETVRRVCLVSGSFKPHDARRTLLTNLLISDTSVADAQFIAGHANPSTTLGYAVIKDANEVKGRIKLNY